MTEREVKNNIQSELTRPWYFTFGHGQKHAGRFVMIEGTFMSTRKEMFEIFGKEWCFQYSEEKFLPIQEEYNYLRFFIEHNFSYKKEDDEIK